MTRLPGSDLAHQDFDNDSSHIGAPMLYEGSLNWELQEAELGADTTGGNWLTGVELSSSVPLGLGAFSDVYKGSYDGQQVAIKYLRTGNHAHRRQRRLCAQFAHEVDLWKDLSHENILPFLGVSQLPNSPIPALLSPWMDNGTLEDYLETSPLVDHLELANILIDKKGTPRISDFGITAVIQEAEINRNDTFGHIRYRAPEIVLGDVSAPTKSSDIYSFGCVCYQIFSSFKPFANISSDIDVILAIYGGTTPFVQANKRFLEPPNIDKMFWDLMLSCWSHAPDQRPQMERIHIELKNFRVRFFFSV
ncbi:hypothetical protein H0H93_000673 [Arthromyces matolae]|nr:hypothetical protein H0H93_000673 [Arthromyces matolae]